MIKIRFVKQKTIINNKIWDFKFWILRNVIKDECIEEYAINTELLSDYYNEPPDSYDYYNDRD